MHFITCVLSSLLEVWNILRTSLKDAWVPKQQGWIFKYTCFLSNPWRYSELPVRIVEDTTIHMSVIEHGIVTTTRLSPKRGSAVENQVDHKASPIGQAVVMWVLQIIAQHKIQPWPLGVVNGISS